MREKETDGGKVWKHKHSDLLWIQGSSGAETGGAPRRKMQEKKKKGERYSPATCLPTFFSLLLLLFWKDLGLAGIPGLGPDDNPLC